jgi:hypothetical protein
MNLKDVADASGWWIAIATATWSLILRVVIGRYLTVLDETQKRLQKIEEHLAVIEDRSKRRRQGDAPPRAPRNP